MPNRQDDNYQYDAGTTNDAALDRYRLYDKGDDGWLEIIDKDTGRTIQIKDGEIRSDRMNGTEIAREEDGDDIFDAVNKAAERAGSDTTIFVVPDEYTRANGNPVSTALETTHEGQIIDFLGGDVEFADGWSHDYGIHISNDSCTIENIVIDGNRDNTTHQAGIYVDNVVDATIRNYEIRNIDNGLEAVGVRGASVDDVETTKDDADIFMGIKFENCENSAIRDCNLHGFEQHGVHLEYCQDLSLDGCVVTTAPAGQSLAEAGFYNEGTIQSRFEVAVESQGDVQYGVLAEPNDIGGTDETPPRANSYDLKIEGAQDVGLQLNDCINESIDGIIDGEYDTGRSNEAFNVAFPNSIVDSPGHRIEVSTVKCTRVTTSNVDSQQAGMHIRGHHQQMQETSSLRFNGSSFFRPSFGPGMPQPAFEVLTGTHTEAQVRAQRSQTGGSGQVSIDWSNQYVFEDKPILDVQLEQAGEWYVSSYQTNADGNYTGATVQVTDSSGTAVGSGVNAIVKLIGA